MLVGIEKIDLHPCSQPGWADWMTGKDTHTHTEALDIHVSGPGWAYWMKLLTLMRVQLTIKPKMLKVPRHHMLHKLSQATICKPSPLDKLTLAAS